MSILRNVLTKTSISPILSKIYVFSKNFHALSNVNEINKNLKNILVPASVAINPVCGFKVMGRVKRRCKDCYFVWRENRLYNICPTHGRHKQMAMKKAERNTWILSHATQGKIRPW